MDIVTAYEEFLSYILFQKRLSRLTYIEYERDIRNFVEFAEEKKVTDLFKITKQLTLDFKQELKNKKLSTRTIYRKISTLREFFKFLKGKYNFDEIILTAPKYEMSLPEICSPQLIKRIIEFMKTDNNPNKLRDELLFQLFYTTGIRVSEIIKIQVKDISFDVRTILINGKGGRQRLVPYPIAIQDNLINYIKSTQTEILFPHSRQYIWAQLKRIGTKMGIKLYPHKLRHSIATHLLEKGANLMQIKKILGHESVNSTCLYTRVNAKLLRKQYDKYHPRARKKRDESLRD